MNIENIAVGNKDAHGLDMSDEAAITLLRHALSKLAEQDVVPYAWDSESMGLTFENHYSDAKPLYTEAQLAAGQAREQQLRDGLSWIARVNALDYEYVEMAKKTLANVSQDTSALEAMIAKTCEAMRERCAKHLDGNWDMAAGLIRALPNITLEDLK